MIKIAIIGSGITGLTLASILQHKYDVTILERKNVAGGLLKCKNINSSIFHTCGGHVYNSKNEIVNDWFWSIFNKDEEFIKLNNKSVIHLNNLYVDYPIEKHIWQLDKITQSNFDRDVSWIISNSKKQANNFAEFLENKFGKTLYDLYFRPYNEKIWKSNLSDIPLDWLDGKLPTPNINEIIECNKNHESERNFVHSSFYYPKQNGSQFIIDKLLANVKIRYNYNIQSIKIKDFKVLINNEEFDKCIFTGNIKNFVKIFTGFNIKDYIPYINNLKYHGTTSVFCELDSNPYTWIYQPTSKHDSHRIICTGNFLHQDKFKTYGTVEFTNYISKDQIVKQLKLMPFNPKYITHNYTKYSYPIQDKQTRTIINSIKHKLHTFNVYLCGRFAEWEYFNMDKCIESAIKLVNYTILE